MGAWGLGAEAMEKMRQVRRQEFVAAMREWGFDFKMLGWPDLEMSFGDLRDQATEVLKLVRRDELTALVSFDPRVVTRDFDHSDHNRTGEISRVVGMAADVVNFLPEVPALRFRPKLFWWQSGGRGSGDYFMKHYPSQFNPENIGVLRRLGREKYLQVR